MKLVLRRAVVLAVFAGLLAAAACDSFEAAESSPDASTTDGAATSDATTSDAAGDGSAEDASADAGRPCNLTWPFGAYAPVNVPGAVSEFTLVGDDELEAIVSLRGDGGNTLHRTSRSSRQASFGPPQPITEVNQAHPMRSLRGGSLSPDELTLLYFFNLAAPPFEIYVAERASPDDSFTGFQKVAIDGVDAATGWVHPHWRRNGDVVLFTTIDPNKVWRANWNGAANRFESPNEVGFVSSFQPQRAAEAAGGDVITFSASVDGGATRLFEAIREGTQLNSPREITELVTNGGETNQDISRDGCRVYFSDVLGNVFVAERKKPL